MLLPDKMSSANANRGAFCVALMISMLFVSQTTAGQNLRWESTENEAQFDMSSAGDDVMDEEHQARIDYIREVFRHVPMTEQFRKHIYETPDPFDFGVPDVSFDAIWRELEMNIFPYEEETIKFIDMIGEYVNGRDDTVFEGKTIARASGSPTTREQIGDYEGCARDYDAYILPALDNFVTQIIERLNVIIFNRCNETDRPVFCRIIISGFLPLLNSTMPAWAIPLLDSYGAVPPTGVLAGKLHWIGSEEECAKRTVQYNYTSTDLSEERTFNGFYCRLDLTHTMRNNTIYPLQYGMCFPDTCSRENISYYLQENNITAFILNTILRREITAVYCGLGPNMQETPDLSQDINGQVAFGLLIAIVIFAIFPTCYDGWGRKNYILRQIRKRVDNPDDIIRLGKRANHDARGRWGLRAGASVRELLAQKPTALDRMEVCWTGFSMYTNLRHMFSTETRENHARALDGVRSLALLWVVSGMAWVFSVVYAESWTTHNLIQAASIYPKEWRFMTTMGTYHANDLFLVVSGAACVLAYYRKWDDNDRKMTPWFFFRYFLNRYWYFLPALALTLNLYMNGAEYLGDGPLNPASTADTYNCQTTWWVVLLLMNNLVKTDQQCYGWAWAYATIFQLNFVSFIALIPLVLLPALGYCFIVAFFIVGVSTTAVFNQRAQEGDAGWYIEVLQAPWCNAAQYAIGLALGVLLHKKKGKADMHPAAITLLWLLAAAAGLAAIYTPFDKFKENGNTWSDDAQVAYSVLAPIGMSLSICWIVFACEVGWGGVVGKILRWRFFTTFSKFVFSSGMMMGALMSANIYGLKDLLYVHDSEITAIARGDIMLLLLYGFFINLFFHYPWSVGFRKAATCRTLHEAFCYGNHPEILDTLGDTNDHDDNSLYDKDRYEDIREVAKDALPRGSDVIREVKGLKDVPSHPAKRSTVAMSSILDRL